MTVTATATLPDFFVVGAPKCGTTALQDWLSQAPDVFMPPEKEFLHFADDLLGPDDPMRDRERYLGKFAAAGEGQRVGEVSVFHLLSEVAAERIRASVPDARIVAMVRNPIEVLPSLHSQLVYNGDEPLEDLAAALDAEADRANGRRVPRGIRFPQKLLYSRVVRFSEQLQRYLDRFDHVQVIVYDDLKADPLVTCRRVLAHVGADPAFEPSIRVVNANKKTRSRALRAILTAKGGALPALARLLPRALRRSITDTLRRMNTAYVPRDPIDAGLRARLTELCAPEIERLGRLLGRDLDHWLRT